MDGQRFLNALRGRAASIRKAESIGTVIALAIAASIGAIFLVSAAGAAGGMSTLPPVAVSIVTEGRTSAGFEPLSGVSVALFSATPGSGAGFNGRTVDLTGADISNNAQTVLLAEGNSQSGIAHLTLGNEFGMIRQGWRGLVPQSAEVSVAMYAQYLVPTTAGLEVWSYYDNVPYSPYSSFTALRATAIFDLTQPPLVLPSPSQSQTVSTQSIGGSGPCPTQTDYTLLNSTTISGPFPLGLVYLNDASTTDNVVLSETFVTQQMQFSFTSDTTNSKQTFVSSSGSPSYSGPGATMTTTASGTDATNSYGDTVAYVYVPGTTIYITNIQIVYQYASGSSCAYVNGGIQDTIEIKTVSDSNNNLYATAQPYTGAVGAIIKYFALQTLETGDFAPGTGFTLSSWMATESAYSNAVQVKNNILGIASAFDAALSIGLAIMDASDILGPAGEASSIPASIDLMANALGVALYIANAMDSLSWSTQYTESMQIIGVTNVQQGPSPAYLTMTAYDSCYDTDLSIGGSTYTVFMPSVIVLATPG